MQTKQDGRLGTEKIGKLMLELALPSVLAQIVNVLNPAPPTKIYYIAILFLISVFYTL